ncbi:NADH-quinone oxidoreductase subunit A [Chloroflexota bacterium]
MLSDFGLLGLFIIAATLVCFVILITPIIARFTGVAPKNKPNPAKNSTYECGMVPAGKAWVQFNFRFYFFAVMFVAFDVLTVFLYPWAANFVGLPDQGYALAAVAILLAIITVGYIYAWKKGALKWQ